MRSCCCAQHSLMVLNVSGNGITSVADLHCLHQLRHLAVADNNLSDVAELTQLLSESWRRLERLDVANNHLCRRSKYRDYVIIASPALGQSVDAAPEPLCPLAVASPGFGAGGGVGVRN